MENAYKDIAKYLIINTYNFAHSQELLNKLIELIKKQFDKDLPETKLVHELIDTLTAAIVTDVSLNLLEPIFLTYPDIVKETFLERTSGEQREIVMASFEKDLEEFKRDNRE